MISRRAVLSAVLAASAMPALASEANEIPLTRSSGGRPLVGVTINGNGPLRFLIDTGAVTTLLRQDVASAIGLKVATHERGMGLGGLTLEEVYLVDELIVGDLVRVRHLVLRGVEGHKDLVWDGALSVNLVTGNACVLDFGANKMRYNIGGESLSAFESVPATPIYSGDRTDNRVCITGSLDGLTMTCLIDTGTSPGLYISTNFVRAHGLWEKYSSERNVSVLGGSTDRTIKGKRASAGRFSFGSFSHTNLEILLADPQQIDGMQVEGIDAIIGMGVLGDYQLAFPGRNQILMCANSKLK